MHLVCLLLTNLLHGSAMRIKTIGMDHLPLMTSYGIEIIVFSCQVLLSFMKAENMCGDLPFHDKYVG